MQYNDNYEPATIDLFHDGRTWELLEQDESILQSQRKSLGLTQKQVADASNIQLRQYQRLESGERNMAGASMRIGLSICKALQLDPYRFAPKCLSDEKPS